MSSQALRDADSGRVDRPAPFAQLFLVLCAFALFGLLPTRNFNYADDSLRWAWELTQSGDLINSHHLFLNAMRGLYQWLHSAGVVVDPVSLLAMYSAFWGALGLVFLYRLLKHAGLGAVAIGGVLVCAFSTGYWCYSIVGDVYVPATALMIAGLDFLYVSLVTPNVRVAWVNAALSVAAFFLMLPHHQAFAAFVVGLVPAVFLLRNSERGRRFLCGIVVPGLVCLLTLGLYAGVYASRPVEERHGFFRFCAGYAEEFDARPDQKKLNFSSVVNAGAGELRAFVSTNVVFRSSKVAHAIQSRYPYRNVYSYPFLVRNLPIPVAMLAAVAAALAVFAGLVLFFRGLGVGLKERGPILLAFVPMIPQILFFAWWEGISDEFALWTLPLLALIMAKGAAHSKRPQAWILFLAGALFVSTFLGSTMLYWNQANDIDAVNDAYVANLGAQDFLVGFEDIQSNHRIKLAQGRQGFVLFDVFSPAMHWNADDSKRFDTALQDAVNRHLRIHVSPRLKSPAESELAFIRTINPRFDKTREEIIAKLEAIEGVDWVKPAVFLDDYFHKDAAEQPPR